MPTEGKETAVDRREMNGETKEMVPAGKETPVDDKEIRIATVSKGIVFM